MTSVHIYFKLPQAFSKEKPPLVSRYSHRCQPKTIRLQERLRNRTHVATVSAGVSAVIRPSASTRNQNGTQTPVATVPRVVILPSASTHTPVSTVPHVAIVPRVATRTRVRNST